MLSLEPREDILEWLRGLSFTDWLLAGAILLGWLLPVLKRLWEAERQRRRRQNSSPEGPIEPH